MPIHADVRTKNPWNTPQDWEGLQADSRSVAGACKVPPPLVKSAMMAVADNLSPIL